MSKFLSSFLLLFLQSFLFLISSCCILFFSVLSFFHLLLSECTQSFGQSLFSNFSFLLAAGTTRSLFSLDSPIASEVLQPLRRLSCKDWNALCTFLLVALLVAGVIRHRSAKPLRGCRAWLLGLLAEGIAQQQSWGCDQTQRRAAIWPNLLGQVLEGSTTPPASLERLDFIFQKNKTKLKPKTKARPT